jgi:hypothetical protein
LTGNEPADLVNYQARHKDFPHQTTADQFFDEAQFESYRALGYQIAKEIFTELAKAVDQSKENRPVEVLNDLSRKDESRERFTRVNSSGLSPPCRLRHKEIPDPSFSETECD